MCELPLDVKRLIVEALVSEVVACAVPPAAGSPHHIHDLIEVVDQARAALKSLQYCSVGWAEASNKDVLRWTSSDMAPPNNASSIRVLVFCVMEYKRDHANVQREVLGACSRAETVILSSDFEFEDVYPSPTTLAVYAAPVSNFYRISTHFPALRTLHAVQLTGTMDAPIPVSSNLIRCLTLCNIDEEVAPHFVAACMVLERLEIGGWSLRAVRRTVASAPTSLRKLLLREWSGFETGEYDSGDHTSRCQVIEDLGEWTRRLSVLTFVRVPSYAAPYGKDRGSPHDAHCPRRKLIAGLDAIATSSCRIRIADVEPRRPAPHTCRGALSAACEAANARGVVVELSWIRKKSSPSAGLLVPHSDPAEILDCSRVETINARIENEGLRRANAALRTELDDLRAALEEATRDKGDPSARTT